MWRAGFYLGSIKPQLMLFCLRNRASKNPESERLNEEIRSSEAESAIFDENKASLLAHFYDSPYS